jgi:superfamily I DNA/RNA helicase
MPQTEHPSASTKSYIHQHEGSRGPTDEQDLYIDAPANAVLIACPGSGKTFACTRRFLKRASVKCIRGVAYLSYTNTAVDEARREITSLGGERYLRPPHFLGTIDAFLMRFVFIPFIRLVAGEVPLEDFRVFAGDRPVPPRIAADSQYKPYDEALGHKSNYFAWEVDYRVEKGVLGFFEGPRTSPVSDVMATEYLEQKRKYLKLGYATHSDVLYWCDRILVDHAYVADILARRFREMIVDEAQDTSGVQQRLLERIEAGGVQSSFVGDPDQSIYQFNGAYPEFLRARYGSSPAKRDLNLNRRSSRQILAVIKVHFGRDMKSSFDLTAVDGPFVVVGSAEQCIALFEDVLKGAGRREADATVLVRDRALAARLMGGLGDTENMTDTTKRLVGAISSLEGNNYRDAADGARDLLRRIFGNSARLADEHGRVAAWRFLRDWLPRPGNEKPSTWLRNIRKALCEFGATEDLAPAINLSSNLTTAGLPAVSEARDLFEKNARRVAIRTIHDAKGETLESVLLFGSEAQTKKWLSLTDKRERPVAYVAMTRASHLLVVGVETEAQAGKWMTKGFRRFPPDDGGLTLDLPA